MFTGLSRDYPGTVPTFSWDFLGKFAYVFPFFHKKGQNINKADPHPFPGQSRKLFMFIGFEVPQLQAHAKTECPIFANRALNRQNY